MPRSDETSWGFLPPELIERSRVAIEGVARPTPLLEAADLSRALGTTVLIKHEGLQRTGSFKVRGAAAALHFLGEEARRGVWTCSAGNHGRGLAVAAKARGVPCQVVVPRTAPEVKRQGIERAGARALVAPVDGYDAAEAWARAEAEAGRLEGTFVSAFDHEAVMAGNGGTLALEILEADPAVDCMLVPTGGAGCLAGVASVAVPRGIRVVAVCAARSPAFACSLADGRPRLELDGGPTLADGLEGGVGAASFAVARAGVSEAVSVEEDEIRAAIAHLARCEGVVAEGAGAVAVAALLSRKVAPGRRTVALLTGSNIQPRALAHVLATTEA